MRRDSLSTECLSRFKKGHMINIYFTGSDEKEFVKDHEQLYDNTYEWLKNKARECCSKGGG